ncbi:IS4 family transposase [Syntrophus buswellii]|uniref:IS4 family transposase n=1 Tax=Syntrophus buswellii TaxID=43774 RepID=UPI0038D3822C
MPYTWIPGKTKQKHKTHVNLMAPVNSVFPDITPLLSGCNRPLKMSFEDQLNILVYYHLEEHRSGRHLLQVLKEEHFARQHIAPEGGIEKSSFFEDISSRGLPQMMEMFGKLYASAAKHLPRGHAELGNLVLIDGSLIDAVLSMYWADYRKGSKKAKVHVGFDLNLGIPKKIFLSDGKEAERSFVEKILAPGETGVMDRGYQSHKLFDVWQADEKHFICRIKASTEKTVIRMNDIQPGNIVFYDAVVLLGTQGTNRTEREVRLVGYQVENVNYWIATDRHDLTAEQIAFAYKLRWNIEIFFAWWKRHLKVYHLISRSQYGLMVQMLAGLITYILLVIYCHDQHQEKVSVKRLREISINIRNEMSIEDIVNETGTWRYKPPSRGQLRASS